MPTNPVKLDKGQKINETPSAITIVNNFWPELYSISIGDVYCTTPQQMFIYSMYFVS